MLEYSTGQRHRSFLASASQAVEYVGDQKSIRAGDTVVFRFCGCQGVKGLAAVRGGEIEGKLPKSQHHRFVGKKVRVLCRVLVFLPQFLSGW